MVAGRRQRPTRTFALPDDPATAWASDAVAGRIVVGELVRLAAKRHLLDLREGPRRGLVWRPDLVKRAVEFFPAVLTVTEGSHVGQPFTLLPWHVFVVGSLFGWTRSDGRRRFRFAWLETGKGQAKSPLMAAIGLYVLGFVGKQRAEIYAVANDKDQANVLFKDAVAMCRATIPDYEEGETLETRGDVVIRGTADNAWKIEHPESSSKFQSLASGEAISGPRPALVLADEVHEMKTDLAITLWKGAIDKMSDDPLMVLGTNTPAADQLVGTGYSEFFQRVVRGEALDDTAFAFIARVDKDDDPFEDESCWPKALPALGITFPAENIRGRVRTAKVLLSEKLATQRLFFGIPVGSVEFWIDEQAWNDVQGEITDEDVKGLPCWLALDLSDRHDLTALTACWKRPDGHLLVRNYYWTRSSGLAERAIADHAPYDQWRHDPATRFSVIAGERIEKDDVARLLQALVGGNAVEFAALDVAGVYDFMAACERVGLSVWRFEGPDKPEGEGLKLVPHAQGPRIVFEDRQLCMPRSVERLEDAMLGRAITIEANPVTRMCAANAQLAVSEHGNRSFVKKRSRGRMDGIVTIAMAVGAATMNEEAAVSIDEFLKNPIWA